MWEWLAKVFGQQSGGGTPGATGTPAATGQQPQHSKLGQAFSGFQGAPPPAPPELGTSLGPAFQGPQPAASALQGLLDQIAANRTRLRALGGGGQ